MIRALDLGDAVLAQQLWALQRAAYRLEAVRIGSDAIPPLHEGLEALQRCGETFLVWLEGSALLGAVSYKRQGDLLDIHRLVVDPSHLRRGIGRALLGAVLQLPAERYLVQTGSDNQPALRLYESLGFTSQGQLEVIPGLWVTRLEQRSLIA